MATPRPPVGFSSIQLTKDFIGVGSYGVVYKAWCNQHLECAAKVIHPVLITVEEGKPEHLHRLPLQRFLKEIDFISSIRHPNIIGYLGMSWDSNKLPVLLMELMDENLTQFLVNALKPLPFRIEVNICRDISLALSFLHSNNIVHRDLSSNNVLMLGDRQAKITDFGMATIFDEQVCSATKLSVGTVYMPPEVKSLYPISCDKIDCFSFGVLCVQILTRKRPKPEDKPQGIFGTLGPDQEIARRHGHISMINKAHPLLPVALSCLKDRYKHRPTSSDICTTLGDLKNVNFEHIDVDNATPFNSLCLCETTPLHTTSPSPCQRNSKQTEAKKEGASPKIGDRKSQSQLDDKLVKFEEKEYNLRGEDDMLVKGRGYSLGGEEVVDSSDRHKSICRASHSDMKKRSEDYHSKRSSSLMKAEPVEEPEYDLEWDELEDEEINPVLSSTGIKTTPVLDISQEYNTRWVIKCTKAPQDIFRTADAVYLNDDGCLYMLCGPERRTVYSFHPVKYDWMQLQDTVLGLSSLVVVGSFVVTVGGTNGSDCSNKLYSHVGFHWKERLPPMPTRRCNPIVAMSGSHLIVAGGISSNKTILTRVEVLDMDTGLWSTVASLPEPSASFAGHVSSGKVWVLGYSNAVFSCRLDRLIESGGRYSFSFTTSTIFMPVWSYDAMPVYSTTLVNMNDNLYAIGGKLHDTNKPTDAVYQYNSWNSNWSIVSHMTTVRSQCLAVSIPRKRMMVVVGGVSEKGTPIKLVEMARLLPTLTE